MRHLRQTMRGFFGSFENLPGAEPFLIPVFTEGYAFIRDEKGRPTDPPMPYITYPLVKQGFGDQSIIMGSIWNRMPGNPGHFALVDHVLEQFRKRFKGGRVVLRLGDSSGGVVLQFDRIGYMDDPDDQDITRGIMQMVVKDFIP